jgi:hypothetical protein
MTEDDTYNVLKKSTFDVVHNEIMLYPQWSYDALVTIVKKHGWSYNEFLTEWNKA